VPDVLQMELGLRPGEAGRARGDRRGYNLAWMVVEDVAKLGLYRELQARRMGTTLLQTRMRTSLSPFGGLHRPAGPRSAAARS
jgi:hypothetical protein